MTWFCERRQSRRKLHKALHTKWRHLIIWRMCRYYMLGCLPASQPDNVHSEFKKLCSLYVGSIYARLALFVFLWRARDTDLYVLRLARRVRTLNNGQCCTDAHKRGGASTFTSHHTHKVEACLSCKLENCLHLSYDGMHIHDAERFGQKRWNEKKKKTILKHKHTPGLLPWIFIIRVL